MIELTALNFVDNRALASLNKKKQKRFAEWCNKYRKFAFTFNGFRIFLFMFVNLNRIYKIFSKKLYLQGVQFRLQVFFVDSKR